VATTCPEVDRSGRPDPRDDLPIVGGPEVVLSAGVRASGVPGVRRSQDFVIVPATDHEDTAVGQERGRMARASAGERAGRAERLGPWVPDLRRGTDTIARTTDDDDPTVG
jgi:hypothetical protein